MIFIKIHKFYRNLVAVCDADLAGMKFEEKFEGGIRQLDIRKDFYKGEEHSYTEDVKIMKMQAREDSTFSIAGKKSIKAALEAGIITKQGIGKIKGIPCALILL